MLQDVDGSVVSLTQIRAAFRQVREINQQLRCLISHMETMASEISQLSELIHNGDGDIAPLINAREALLERSDVLSAHSMALFDALQALGNLPETPFYDERPMYERFVNINNFINRTE